MAMRRAPETVDHHIWGAPERMGVGYQNDSDSLLSHGASSGDSSQRRFNTAVAGLSNVKYHDSESESDISSGLRQVAGASGLASGSSQPWASGYANPHPGLVAEVFNLGALRNITSAAHASTQMDRMPADEQARAQEDDLIAGARRAAISSDANIKGERQEVEAAQVAMAELHAAGNCRPCLYYNSKKGCMNGGECRFCHLAHRTKARPCKSKRTECKQIADMLHSVFGEESEEFRQAANQLSAESPYMRTILGKTRLGGPPAAAAAAASASVIADANAKAGFQSSERLLR